jgi:nicotinamidase-related amidase
MAYNSTGRPTAEIPALVLLDLQRDFLESTGKKPVDLSQVDGLLRSVEELSNTFVERAWPVARVGNEFPRHHCLNPVRKFAAVVGTAGTAWDPRASGTGAPYFVKDRRDAFSNPGFEEWLTDSGSTRVIVVGVFAEACVAATALSALRRGYTVSVPEDAVAGSTERSTNRALERLRQRGVDTSNSSAARSKSQ